MPERALCMGEVTGSLLLVSYLATATLQPKLLLKGPFYKLFTHFIDTSGLQ
jgi:hypothetical protein